MNRQNILPVWNAVQVELRRRLGELNYSKWISSLEATESTGSNGSEPYEMIITAENQYTLRWINRNYKALIEQLISAELNGSNSAPPKIVFRCRPGDKSAPPKRAGKSKVAAANPSVNPVHKYEGQLDTRHSFAKLVVYEGNMLAVKLARDSLADVLAPRGDEMPHHGSAIICAASGIGKTHLLQAMANELDAQNKPIRTVYVTANKFVQVLVRGIAAKTIDEVRSFYQAADLLLMDDIHFLAGKQKSQEEFLNLFNYFATAGKTMILSCDAPPQSIKGLNSQLRTRLAHSLLAPIAKPDLEARIKLVLASARKYRCALNEACALCIAARIDRSVRELEGAVKMVVYYAGALKKPINEELINGILQDIAPPRAARIDMDAVAKAVAARQNVSVADIKSDSRQSTLVLCRQMAMHLCRELTEHSTTEIGAYFGGRNHSAVLYSTNKFAARIKKQAALRSACAEIKTQLNSSL